MFVCTPSAVAGTELKLSSGYNHIAMVRESDRSVWSWGLSSSGQLGNNGWVNSSTPVQASLPGGTRIVQVECGMYHTVALDENGHVWCWGLNLNGQLGNNTTTTSAVPVQVLDTAGSTPLGSVVRICAGGNMSFAVLSSGQVAAWGQNVNWGLGDGTTTQRNRPVILSALSGVTGMSSEGNHTLAIVSGGTSLMGWGVNGVGQLGKGDTSNTTAPVAITVPGLSGRTITTIACGTHHTLALLSDGSMMAWGWNQYGRIGRAATSMGAVVTSAVAVDTLTGVVAISAGMTHSLAVKSDGTVRAWGRNNNGQLGNGNTVDSSVPLQPSLTNVKQAAAGQYFSVAVKNDGTVWTWGANDLGQLGASGAGRSTPAAIAGLTGVSSVSAGTYHTLAALSDGTVKAWGGNYNGQTGVSPGTTAVTSPTLVSGLSNIIEVAAGSGHSLALDSTGHVYSWGANSDGQLGDGTNSDRTTATQITSLSNVVAITAGSNFSIALLSGGGLYTWGGNAFSQLGNGYSYTSRNTPSGVMSSVKSISAGFYHVVAIMTNGQVLSWGDNSSGQLGQGNRIHPDYPIPALRLEGVEKIESGIGNSFAIKKDGRLMAWGTSTAGELADGYIPRGVEPSLVLGINRLQVSPVLALSPADATVVPMGSTVQVKGTFTSQTYPLGYSFFYTRGIFLDEVGTYPFSWSYTPQTWGDIEINDIASDQIGVFSKPVSIRLRTPYDFDSDGLPDYWEVGNMGELAGASGDDADGDGRTNLQEFQDGTDANNPDTDGDGLSDGIDPNRLVPDYTNFVSSGLMVISPLK